MWDTVGIIAGFVAIIFLLQLLDLPDILKARLKGGSTSKEIEERVAGLEQRLEALEKKGI
jgi:hypothetical protein